MMINASSTEAKCRESKEMASLVSRSGDVDLAAGEWNQGKGIARQHSEEKSSELG